MRYAIDGSNTLLGLRVNKKPSVRLFARLLAHLKSNGDQFELFFDNSIRRKMAEASVEPEWLLLESMLAAAGIRPTFSPRADPLIERHCAAQKAAVINSTDKMDSWGTRPTLVHRARAIKNHSGLRLVVMDDETGRFVFNISGQEAFEFGGVRHPSLDLDAVSVEPLIAKDSQSYSTSVAVEGTLLVFALDASASMEETKSYDGRKKSEHLNGIVKDAIRRLQHSCIADALYIAILRFENDVTPMPAPTGAVFASVSDWFGALDDFDYLRGVNVGYTNIRLALQRSKELIQNTIADSDAMYELADAWRAAVILITDGKHCVRLEDGTFENEHSVAREALDIHEGVAGLIRSRIDVGCVGIGEDVNRKLLADIASRCSPTQLGMATRARILDLLLDQRMCVLVDSNRQDFAEAVRSFIDLASGSA